MKSTKTNFRPKKLRDFLFSLARVVMPYPLRQFAKHLIHRPRPEVRWLGKAPKFAPRLLNDEVVVTPSGELFVRGPFETEFRLHLGIATKTVGVGIQEEFLTFIDIVRRNIKPNDVVLDIGANVGIYGVTIGKLFPGCHVYCFEPVTETYLTLQRNIARNKLINTHPIKCAAGEMDGMVQMTTSYGTGNYVVNQHSRQPALPTELVEVVKLDSYVRNHHLQNVSIVKCDVEGYELQVLQGALETIRECKPIVMLEVREEWVRRFGEEPGSVFRLLAGLQYEPFAIHTDGKLQRLVDGMRGVPSKSFNFVFFPHWAVSNQIDPGSFESH